MNSAENPTGPIWSAGSATTGTAEAIRELEEEFPGWRIATITSSEGITWRAVQASTAATFWDLYFATGGVGPVESAARLRATLLNEIARQAERRNDE